MDKKSFLSDYNGLEPAFERLRTTAHSMVVNALSEARIDTLHIQSRVKNFESAYTKYLEKGYSDPFNEITDFVALRVIVFVENDIELASEALRGVFEVDEDNTVDKRQPPTAGMVGYRSLHIVFALGKERAKLPEYQNISNVRFEVQIRTALQHAWAEIEHKQNYKSQFSLPTELQHRLMRISGTLEMIDREFSNITLEAQKYAIEVREDPNDQTRDESISEIALKALFERAVESAGIDKKSLRYNPDTGTSLSMKAVIEELRVFDVLTVGQLRKLIGNLTSEDLANFQRHDVSVSLPRFYRAAMIKKDVDKFLEATKHDLIASINIDNIRALESITGSSDLEQRFEKAGIPVVPF